MNRSDVASVTITVDDAHSVSGLLLAPSGRRACYVLAHGAGAGMFHPFMDAVARELGERGIATLRYQFPYMEQRARRPDPPKLAHATVRAAVAASRAACTGTSSGRRRQVLRRPHDVAGAGRISLAGRPRPRLSRLSPASGGAAVGRACRASFRGRGPDAVSARDPRQARGRSGCFAVDRAARRARIVAAVPRCRSFLPRAGPRRTKGRRRQTGNDGYACRLDRVGDLPATG